MKTVHALKHGLPMCGFSRELPADWPDGHAWISFQEWELNKRGGADQGYEACQGCDVAMKQKAPR